MKKRDRRRIIKEFYITSFDDLDWLASGWYSSRDAFLPGSFFEVDKAVGFARTNLSLRDCRALFRHVGVRMPDYVTGIEEDE